MVTQWIVSAGLVAGLAAVGLALPQGQGGPVAKKDIPPAVMRTAEHFADGFVFERCVRTDEDGLQIYQLVFKKDKRSIEVQTTMSGGLVATEEVVAVADLPELVRTRATKAFQPGAELACERALIAMHEIATKDENGREVEILVNQAGAAFEEIAGGVIEEGATDGKAEEPEGKDQEDASVARKEIPAAVMHTAEQFADGGVFDRCVRGDEDGLQVYELVFKKDERSIEVQTTISGDLVATEEVVEVANLPELVRSRAMKAFKAGAKLTCERALIAMHEIAAKDENGHTVEILVNRAGAAFREIDGGMLEKATDKASDQKGK